MKLFESIFKSPKWHQRQQPHSGTSIILITPYLPSILMVVSEADIGLTTPRFQFKNGENNEFERRCWNSDTRYVLASRALENEFGKYLFPVEYHFSIFSLTFWNFSFMLILIYSFSFITSSHPSISVSSNNSSHLH